MPQNADGPLKDPAQNPIPDKLAAALSQDGFLQLDKVEPRDRRTRGAKIVVYDPAQGVVSVEASREWGLAGLNSKVSQPKPSYGRCGKVDPDKSIPLVPAFGVETDLLEIAYIKNRAKINFIKLFTLLELRIPSGSVMEIPVEYHDHETYGPCLKLKMAEATFRGIEERDQEDAEIAKG